MQILKTQNQLELIEILFQMMFRVNIAAIIIEL